VETLRVRHVIICGHYGCGGLRAAMDGGRHGIIDHWLHPIRDVAEANREVLSGISDNEARHRRLCELTVAAQVEGLSRTPIIQSSWRRGSPLAIHGWIYDLGDGRLRDLSCTRTVAARQ